MEHGSTSHCRDRVLPFSKTGAICWGTEGSNPSPSRRESAANLRQENPRLGIGGRQGMITVVCAVEIVDRVTGGTPSSCSG